MRHNNVHSARALAASRMSHVSCRMVTLARALASSAKVRCNNGLVVFALISLDLRSSGPIQCDRIRSDGSLGSAQLRFVLHGDGSSMRIKQRRSIIARH